jgi:hypothetical protein
MPNLKALICSEGVSVDIATKQLSIFNIFEQIGAIQFPVLIGNLCVVGIVEKIVDDKIVYDGSLIIKNNGVDIARTAFKVDFKTGTTNRSISKIQGIAVQSPGALDINFELDGKTVGNTRIEITLATQENIKSMNIDI